MQRGITHIFLLITVVLVAAIGSYVYISSSKSQPARNQTQTDSSPQNKTGSNEANACSTPVKFTHHFTDVNSIDSIIPPVFRNSRGTMPTTLLNIHGKATLYMPTSGRLVQGSYHTEEGAEFYMWEADVGCGVTVIFDHVTEPIEKIKNLFPATPRADTRTDNFENPIEIAGGELVGYTTGSTNAHNWNFAVYDSSEKNYLWEKTEFKDTPKYYTQVCPFKYYDDSMAEVYVKLFVLSRNDISVEKNLCED